MPKLYQIGYFDDSQGPGGTTRYLRELLSGLPRAEFEPVFFAPETRPWHDELRGLGVEVVTLHPALPSDEGVPDAESEVNPRGTTTQSWKAHLPPAVSWSLGLVRETRRLERLFRKRPVDLLHTNNCGAEPAPIAAKRAGVPVVLGTWHVDSTYDLDGERTAWRYRKLERVSMLSLDHAIAVSAATGEDWLRRCSLGEAYRRRLTVVHNGVEPERLRRRWPRSEAKAVLGLAPDAPVLGSLGRLDPAKGYTYLIQALPQVLAEFPQARVVIGGRGPLRDSLEAEARANGTAHAIHWAGFLTEIRDVLEALDLYVQPSLCEALPLGVLEAMAAGLPVVGANVGGMAEAISEGVTGSVIPARDSASLAKAINYWLSDLTRCEVAGAASATRVQEYFSRERMQSETVAVYRALLQFRPQPSS